MRDSSSNERHTGAPPNELHGGGHRKHPTPTHSPNLSPRRSQGNLSSASSSLMDRIHSVNLHIRRKSSPAISVTGLSNVPMASLRGSLALRDALSSTDPVVGSSKHHSSSSSRQSGYSGYPPGNSGVANEHRRKSHATIGYIEPSRRVSSSPSIEKGMYVTFILVFFYNLCA